MNIKNFFQGKMDQFSSNVESNIFLNAFNTEKICFSSLLKLLFVLEQWARVLNILMLRCYQYLLHLSEHTILQRKYVKMKCQQQLTCPGKNAKPINILIEFKVGEKLLKFHWDFCLPNMSGRWINVSG